MKGLGILLLVYGILRWPVLGLPLERDEGAYAYAGRMWVSGQGLPYRDVFEMKPPLLHLVYGMIYRLGGEGFGPIRTFSLAYGAATVLVWYGFLKQALGDEKQALALGTAFVVLASDYLVQGPNFNAEALQMLPMAVFLWAAWGRRWKVMGLAGAAVVLFKQTGVVPVLFTAAVVMNSDRDWRGWAKMLAAAAIPVVVFAAYFWQKGAGPEAVRHLGEYASLSTQQGLAKRWCSREGNAGCVMEWLGRWEYISAIPVTGLAMAGWITGRKEKSRWWRLGLAYTAGVWVMVKLAGWKDWGHYYMLFAPGLVMGLGELKGKINKKMFWVGVGVVLAVNGLLVLSGPRRILLMQYGKYDSAKFWDAVEAGEWIKENVPEEERVLVWNDEAQIYYYAGRKAPTRYPYYYLFELKPEGEEKKRWLREVRLSPPEWAVTTEKAEWGMNELWEEFSSEIDYRKEREIGVYSLWRRV